MIVMRKLAATFFFIFMGQSAMAQNAIESKNAQLSGAPIEGQKYTYDGYPVSNAVAYSMSHQNKTDDSHSLLVSPFSDHPSYKPYNNRFLREAVLRAAKAIIENPDKDVWTVQTYNGEIELFVGNYGNVNASVSLGAIIGTDAEKYDLEFANASLADANEIYKSRGKTEMYSGVSRDPPITAINPKRKWWWK